MKLKKFNQFNSGDWIGPVEILDVNDRLYRYDLIETNLGTFKNSSGDRLVIGYSYILRVVDNEIVETGTFHGDGSTDIFAKTGKYVFTIECNWDNYVTSYKYLSQYLIFIINQVWMNNFIKQVIEIGRAHV